MRTPRFTEAQDGLEAPQSAQTESGCRDLLLENIAAHSVIFLYQKLRISYKNLADCRLVKALNEIALINNNNKKKHVLVHTHNFSKVYQS